MEIIFSNQIDIYKCNNLFAVSTNYYQKKGGGKAVENSPLRDPYNNDF